MVKEKALWGRVGERVYSLSGGEAPLRGTGPRAVSGQKTLECGSICFLEERCNGSYL